jgi:WD40 repeat protein
VWDDGTGLTLLTYTGHGAAGNVYALAWSHDGARIASGADDKTVRVWDAATGATALAFTGHQNIVFNVAWSPDDTRIASVSQDGTLQVWQPKVG